MEIDCRCKEALIEKLLLSFAINLLQNAIAEERHIIQFHYTEWHSHTCPFSNAVLEFRRRVRAVVGNIITANSRVGPMLVHCK